MAAGGTAWCIRYLMGHKFETRHDRASELIICWFSSRARINKLSIDQMIIIYNWILQNINSPTCMVSILKIQMIRSIMALEYIFLS